MRKGWNLPESFQGPDSLAGELTAELALGASAVGDEPFPGRRTGSRGGWHTIDQEASVGEHFTSKESLSGDSHMGRPHKRSKEPKRRVGPSAFPLFGNERSQNLAGER